MATSFEQEQKRKEREIETQIDINGVARKRRANRVTCWPAASAVATFACRLQQQ